MATKYPKSAQTGNQGVDFVRQTTTSAGAIYRPFDTPDLGVDGTIELLNEEREPSGDLVLVQVKGGESFVRGNRFFVDTDRSHFETWARYAIPVVGIVWDPKTDTARWVDISRFLRDHPERISDGPFSIVAPKRQRFSVEDFPSFVGAFRRSQGSATSIEATPNLLIREWRPADSVPTKALLQPIAIDYPDFELWLNKKLASSDCSKKVVAYNGAIGAFSMWQCKDTRNVKLQTFIVGSLFRGTAIGQHLLYHELRTWARNPKIERAHVTVSSAKTDLIGYFKEFGFRVEGFAPNRYDRESGAAELIMAKHFVPHVIRTPQKLSKAVDHIAKRIWGIGDPSDERFGVIGKDLVVHAQFDRLNVNLNLSTSTVSPRISLVRDGGEQVATYDDALLMREFFPLRIHLIDKGFVLVPIYKQWAREMLSTSGPDTPLKLRVDNAYYCYPRTFPVAGDLVIFYEPKKDGGRGSAIGSAVSFEVATDSAERLHERFGPLGIYTISNIESHANKKNGKSMAIRFGLFEPFLSEVPLARIRAILGKRTNVQGLTRVDRDSFERVRSEGLS